MKGTLIAICSLCLCLTPALAEPPPPEPPTQKTALEIAADSIAEGGFHMHEGVKYKKVHGKLIPPKWEIRCTKTGTDPAQDVDEYDVLKVHTTGPAVGDESDSHEVTCITSYWNENGFQMSCPGGLGISKTMKVWVYQYAQQKPPIVYIPNGPITDRTEDGQTKLTMRMEIGMAPGQDGVIDVSGRLLDVGLDLNALTDWWFKVQLIDNTSTP